MATVTKVIELNGTGAGSVEVGPCFYVGSLGVTSVENHGDQLGTAFLTKATERFVVGQINVSGGSADGEGVIYLDRD